MTSSCDKSDVAQTHPCRQKVAPFDGIETDLIEIGCRVLTEFVWARIRPRGVFI
jgi:hypothetical protein